MKKKHNKLIRDKIPQIIEKNNQKPIIKELNKEEFIEKLFDKLIEEANEIIEAQEDKKELKEEIADIYEVIDNIVELYELDKKEILSIQDKKRKERGSFKKKIFLKEVED